LLDHDFGWDDGLICGGKVQGLIVPHAQNQAQDLWVALLERKEPIQWGIKRGFSIGRVSLETSLTDLLYRETLTPQWNLWIAGAGPIAQAVAPLALQLDFNVTVFDDRPALANHQLFPKEVVVKADLWDKLLSVALPQIPSFGLIVTRGHRHDALVLKDWIHKPFLFLGMIGSARKARTIREHFIEEKIATVEQLSRVACPVGTRIGSTSVMEIAVSIVGQFIEKRAQLRTTAGISVGFSRLE
jgi:xanthine dehydrogenase accessory factor